MWLLVYLGVGLFLFVLVLIGYGCLSLAKSADEDIESMFAARAIESLHLDEQNEIE